MLTISVTRFYGKSDGVRVWVEADGYNRSKEHTVPRHSEWSDEEYTAQLTKTAGIMAARELERYRKEMARD